MGTDKLALALGASTVLGELLARVPPSVPVVVVGPQRSSPTRRGVLVTREEPPGGGPVAAVAAGLQALADSRALRERPGEVAPDVVVVCAGDAPWSPGAVPAVVAALRAAPPVVRCAVALDAGGQRQVLLAAHRREPLVEHLAAAEAGGGLAGRAARWLVGPDALEVPVAERLLADVDTPEQLRAARRRD